MEELSHEFVLHFQSNLCLNGLCMQNTILIVRNLVKVPANVFYTHFTVYTYYDQLIFCHFEICDSVHFSYDLVDSLRKK